MSEYVPIPYPAWRYHPTQPAKVVSSEEESEALGPLWVDTPEKAEKLKAKAKLEILPGEPDLGPDPKPPFEDRPKRSK